VFAGGVAKNEAMVALLRAGFQGEVLVPDDAQTVGALGAALSAWVDGREGALTAD
jgi:activator of 2-hydroxyglutaryl-CoA dehydratase